MKKMLLTAAAAVSAMSMMAVEMPTNYVVNGDFEDGTGIETNVPWNWDPYDQFEAVTNEIPGWTKATSGEWNGIVQYLENEPDDEYVFEGNAHCVALRRCPTNGWDKINLSQVVKGLTPGQEYTFGALLMWDRGDGPDWVNQEHGVVIAPCNEDGSDAVGDMLLADDFAGDQMAWQAYSRTFKPSTSCVKITMYLTNWANDQIEGNTGLFTFDDIVVMNPEDYDYFMENREEIQNAQNAGVENVAEDLGASEVKAVYNLQGVEVAKTTEGLKGLYIVRTGKGAKKVIL